MWQFQWEVVVFGWYTWLSRAMQVTAAEATAVVAAILAAITVPAGILAGGAAAGLGDIHFALQTAYRYEGHAGFPFRCLK